MTAGGLRAMAAAGSLAVMAAAASAGDDLPPPVYGLKDDPLTGSNIRRVAVQGSRVPLNRRYEQLTHDERRSVANWYESLRDGDEPPFPSDGLGPMYAALHRIVSREPEQGSWTFVVAVDPGGAATGVSLAKGEPSDGIRRMAAVLMLTRFKPAICAGTPCAMSFPVRLSLMHAF